MLRWLFSCLALLPVMAPAAEPSCTEDAIIVFDGSGSMAEMGFNHIGEPRIFEARRAMHKVLPEIAALRRLGLVVYGPHGDKICHNSELRLAPQWDAAPPIAAEIDGLHPVGGTPLTEAVMMAAQTLRYRERPGTIVLITDGDETCEGKPCALAEDLANTAAGLVVHVIGFKVRGKHFSWDRPDYTDADSNARCLADTTGGEYLRAESVEELIGAMRVTLGCNVYGALDPAITLPETR